MLQFQYFLPTRLLFGPGVLDLLAETPFLPKGSKALIVMSSGGSMVRSGVLGRIQGLLSARGVGSMVYDRVRPNPESEQVDEAAAVARDSGADFLVGLGGGSPLDVARTAASMARNPGRFWDYVQGGSGGKKTPENPPLPTVAIPTTAGTGSEMNCRAVISKTGSSEKLAWGSEADFAALAVVDPDLTLTLPPRQTALTGLDAMFHAMEGFLSTRRQPITDLMALEAVHLVANHLPKALADGSDRAARTVLAWAATSGGICLSQAGATAQHALEHALSALRPDLPHAAGLVLLCRAFFRRLAEKAPDRFLELSLALGCPELEAGPEGFHRALDRLLAEVGLGELKARDFGLDPSMAGLLADNALATNERLIGLTPGGMDRADLVQILEEALA